MRGYSHACGFCDKSFRNRLGSKITFNCDHCCDYVIHNRHTLILTLSMLLFINVNLIQISRSIIHESLKQCIRYKDDIFNLNFKLILSSSITDTKLKQLITNCTKIVKENIMYMNVICFI